MTGSMEEEKNHFIKVDLHKFIPCIDTENLRILRDEVQAELRNRAAESRKNAPHPKPVYVYWTGKVVRRIGSAFSRSYFFVEPDYPESLPDYISKDSPKTFPLKSGCFRKDTCPKIGDRVRLVYRAFKRQSSRTSFLGSRIESIISETELF